MLGLGLRQTTRVNEPGRAFWIKASYAFQALEIPQCA
jgi:hypothetical protein